MPYTKINVRSPRIISKTGTANEIITVELYIWRESGSEPTLPSRVLSKPIPTSIVTTVHFDISPYLSDLISHETNTVVTAETATDEDSYVYCKAKVIVAGVLTDTLEFIAYNGYGYYEDGLNPEQNSNLLLDEGTYYTQENVNKSSVYFHDDSAIGLTFLWDCLDGTTSSENTSNTISNGHIPSVHPNHLGLGGSKLSVFGSTGGNKVFTFKEVCEPKYTPITCDFINKYGAWQTLVFFKANRTSLSVSDSMFNSSPSNVDYNTSQSVKQSFNINGQESIKVNTGWVLESYSEVIKQLLLSDTIRLDNRPVNIKTKAIELHESINERNINYSLEFDYANNVINNIQ